VNNDRDRKKSNAEDDNLTKTYEKGLLNDLQRQKNKVNNFTLQGMHSPTQVSEMASPPIICNNIVSSLFAESPGV
jgi:hypothetical protein